MPPPNFQNQFNPYANWQQYAPIALGGVAGGEGFNPLQQAEYDQTAEFQDVMTPKTDWLDYLSQLKGLPAANANWAGGTVDEGGGGWGTGLLNDIQIGGFYGGNQNPSHGNEGWGWNWGGANGGTGGSFDDLGYRPGWNLGSKLAEEGIEPWLGDDSQGGIADPNYDPSQFGIETAGSYNPEIQDGISTSSPIFQSQHQFPSEEVTGRYTNYVPGLQEALGTGTDMSSFGTDFSSGQSPDNYSPSYIDTGRGLSTGTDYPNFVLPAGQGGSAGGFGYNAEPYMLAANPLAYQADTNDNMYNMQRAFNYGAMQTAGVESGLGNSQSAGNPQQKLQGMVQNAALGNPWGVSAEQTRDALAWNRFERDADSRYNDLHKAMAPGAAIDSAQNKAALKSYIKEETPLFTDAAQGQGADNALRNMKQFAQSDIAPSDVGYIDPSQAQASEQQNILDWQMENIWQNPALSPTKLKNPFTQGSVGQMEREGLGNIQKAWNDPTNTLSLQNEEIAARKLAQEREMQGMENFQDYRTDDVVGDYLTQNTLLGDVDTARNKLMQDTSNIQQAYQGVGGKRPTAIQGYDDYLWNKLDSTDPTAYSPTRQAEIDKYNVDVMGGGGATGYQTQMQNSIDAIHGNYLESGGGTTHEGSKLQEFGDQFTTTTDSYDQSLRDLESQYWLTADEKEVKRDEIVKDASKDWRQGKRDLDLQMQEGGAGTSKLRRDIRGFKGGNILSGRRNRRSDEEYGKAMMDRAELMRQQKDLTDERRLSQKKARTDYTTEMDILDETTQTSATNLFGDSEVTLGNKAANVSSDLADYQEDIQAEVYGDATSPIKEKYGLKQGLESGPGSYAEGLSDQYATFKGDIEGQTDPGNFRDTLGDIQDWKAKAMGEGIGGQPGYYGAGGIRDQYQTSADNAMFTAANAGGDASDAGNPSLSDISADRNTYKADALGALNKFQTTRGTEGDTLAAKYGNYTGDVTEGWGQDLKSKYGGGAGLISAVAGPTSGTGRAGMMDRFMSGGAGSTSPWYNNDAPAAWAPDMYWSGAKLGPSGNDSDYGSGMRPMTSGMVNPSRNLFGRDLNALTHMNTSGNDYHSTGNFTMRGGSGLNYGLGRSDKVGATHSDTYWGGVFDWNAPVYEVPYLQNQATGPQGPMNWDFSTALASVRR